MENKQLDQLVQRVASIDERLRRAEAQLAAMADAEFGDDVGDVGDDVEPDGFW